MLSSAVSKRVRSGEWVLLLTSLLLACHPDLDPGPVTLYLRQATPSGGLAFDRVNAGRVDLGSLSLQPPAGPEYRSCGDVVAFGVEPGTLPVQPLYIAEVQYRVWWYTGAGRGTFALNAPGLEEGVAQLPVASCDPTPEDSALGDGYALALARVPVGRTLTAEQLRSMYLTLDAGNSAVKVVTCSDRRSLVILNPPSVEEQGRLDSDKDGLVDAEELRLGRDPFVADSPAAGCLPSVGTVTPPSHETVPAVPEGERVAIGAQVIGTQRFPGQVVVRGGDLEISGTLELDDAWLVLEPDPVTGRPPRVVVRAGGALLLRHSTLLAPDPRVGFHVSVEPGAALTLDGSTVAHGGFLHIGPDGRVGPETAAISLKGPSREVRDTTFLHNVLGLELDGDRASISGCTFIGNGTAIRAKGEEGRIANNRSQADGLFLLLEPVGGGWDISSNTVEWSIEAGLRVAPSLRPNRVVDNRFLDGNVAFSVTPHEGELAFVRNFARSCRDAQDPFHGVTAGLTLDGNHSEPSSFEGCPRRSPREVTRSPLPNGPR